ncbi:MAG TPA: hypothetical protein VFU22_24870 [Roseiflexaceae bacterium]|nr:hypothetical protein [Roseiflexaceae bacterium]
MCGFSALRAEKPHTTKMSLAYLSWSALLPLALLLVVRLVWRRGLRNYGSASS